MTTQKEKDGREKIKKVDLGLWVAELRIGEGWHRAFLAKITIRRNSGARAVGKL